MCNLNLIVNHLCYLSSVLYINDIEASAMVPIYISIGRLPDRIRDRPNRPDGSISGIKPGIENNIEDNLNSLGMF